MAPNPDIPDLTLPDLTLRQRVRNRFPDGVSRRAVGIGATIAIELLILLMLLSLGVNTGPAAPQGGELTTFDARESAEAETPEAETEEDSAEPETPTTQPETPVPVAAAQPPSALPRPSPIYIPPAPVAPPPPPDAQPAPETPPQPPRARAVVRPGSGMGPPANTGRQGPPDSQIVGTAPDGSPLYAASWYTEPTQQQLAGFMDGARGPGWGLIACRTARNWRVEDCVVLGESPAGSNIAGSFNAAAWQFLVRPARVDGEYLIGSWVRIRMDYGIRPR